MATEAIGHLLAYKANKSLQNIHIWKAKPSEFTPVRSHDEVFVTAAL